MSNIKVLGQYVKDLSFEVPNSPAIFLNPQGKPDISLVINIDAQKISDELYEVSLKISADATEKNKRSFLCELSYAGIFSITNVEDDMIEQILLIYCPNLLFPFVRRIISSNTIDAGFPPLMLDQIDFADLYAKRQKSAAAAAPASDTTN
jgi:preprotein translocase subunit SecB